MFQVFFYWNIYIYIYIYIYSKVDLGPCHIAMIELFNGWKLLPIFAKSSISDVQGVPESASETFCAYAKSLQLY